VKRDTAEVAVELDASLGEARVTPSALVERVKLTRPGYYSKSSTKAKFSKQYENFDDEFLISRTIPPRTHSMLYSEVSVWFNCLWLPKLNNNYRCY